MLLSNHFEIANDNDIISFKVYQTNFSLKQFTYSMENSLPSTNLNSRIFQDKSLLNFSLFLT